MDYVIKLTPVGAEGAAVATEATELPVRGYVQAVLVERADGIINTTTVAISEVGGLGRTILTVAAGDTDELAYPRVVAQGTDGADLTGVYVPIYLSGRYVQAVVGDSDPITDGVIVTLSVVEESIR